MYDVPFLFVLVITVGSPVWDHSLLVSTLLGLKLLFVGSKICTLYDVHVHFCSAKVKILISFRDNGRKLMFDSLKTWTWRACSYCQHPLHTDQRLD